MTNVTQYPNNRNVQFTNIFENRIDFSNVGYLALTELWITSTPADVTFPLAKEKLFVQLSTVPTHTIQVYEGVQVDPPDSGGGSVPDPSQPGIARLSHDFTPSAMYDAANLTNEVRAVAPAEFADEAALDAFCQGTAVTLLLFATIQDPANPAGVVTQRQNVVGGGAGPGGYMVESITLDVAPLGLSVKDVADAALPTALYTQVAASAEVFNPGTHPMTLFARNGSGEPIPVTQPRTESPVGWFTLAVRGRSGTMYPITTYIPHTPDTGYISQLVPRTEDPPTTIFYDQSLFGTNSLFDMATRTFSNAVQFRTETTPLPTTAYGGGVMRHPSRPRPSPYSLRVPRLMAGPGSLGSTPTFDNLLLIVVKQLDVDRLAGAESAQVLAVVPFDFTQLASGFYRIPIPTNSLAWKHLSDVNLRTLDFEIYNGVGQLHPDLDGKPYEVTLQLRFI